MDIDDISDCVVTFKQAKERLEEIEFKLGEKFGFKNAIRAKLLELECAGKLDGGDELVRDWQEAFSLYFDFLSESMNRKTKTT